MPRDNTKFAVVRSSELSAAIQRVAQFADERSGAVRLRLEGNELKISANSTESGESEDTIDTPYSSDPIIVGFNSVYILDFLKALSNEGEVRLEFKDSQSAGQMRPEDPDAEYKYRYVLCQCESDAPLANLPVRFRIIWPNGQIILKTTFSILFLFAFCYWTDGI